MGKYDNQKKSKTATHIGVSESSALLKRECSQKAELGYTSCGCDNPTYDAGIVLDPFGGTCTTAIAAKQLNRHYAMIELKPEYITMAEERIAKESVPKPKRKTKADKQAEYDQWLEERQMELF